MVEQQIESLRGVRQLLAGGDVLSVPHVLRVLEELPNCQLINGYGPTENTTFTCCFRFPRNWPGGGSAPIGRPIRNTRVYVLDERLVPVPIGVPGELYIAGDGLACGYVNSPELNAQKFIPDPFATGSNSKLYRSGDLARYRPDGTLEFLGRLDDQVKINGFRIHLGEVEAAVQNLSCIRQAVVSARAIPGSLKELVAYVVADFPTKPQELRAGLSEALPGYMLPAHFVQLQKLPLTANGKIDRRALPAPGEALAQTGCGAKAETAVEERIVQIWRELFHKDQIGIDDSFFDLGGHSLLATRVVSRVNHALKSNISVATLLGAPTIRELAGRISAQDPAASPPPITRRRV
jgi:acyl-CoA synthetase (AMP-forming)/AMP-acid ligase II